MMLKTDPFAPRKMFQNARRNDEIVKTEGKLPDNFQIPDGAIKFARKNDTYVMEVVGFTPEQNAALQAERDNDDPLAYALGPASIRFS